MKYIGVSLKTYFTRADTLAWLEEIATRVQPIDGVQLVIFPEVFALADARRILPSHIEVGAQGIDPHPLGAFTGALNAQCAFDAGARFAEIAHAERRAVFGETDELFAQVIAAAVREGLRPWVCIGELTCGTPEQAAQECIDQMLALSLPSGSVVAYEPVWAIGADEPAPAQYVVDVIRLLRAWSKAQGLDVNFVYGGTAGPGTISALGPDVDGVFLGRRAHNVDALEQVIAEAVEELTSLAS